MSDVQAGVNFDIVLDPDGENIGLVLAPGGWQMRQALPFAAKPGTAKPERSFADLTDWSVWEQTEWAHGALQEDFDDEGMYLFGNIDSRFSHQLILPPRPRYEAAGAGTAFFCGVQDMTPLAFGGASPIERYAQQFECAAEIACTHVYLWVGREYPAVVRVELRTDNAGVPGTLLRFGTVEVDTAPKWQRFSWASYTLAATTKYWLVIFPTTRWSDRALVGYDSDAGYADGLAKKSTDSGANWTAFSGDFYFIIHDGWRGEFSMTGPFAVFKDDEYIVGGHKVYVHDDANSDWDDTAAGMNAAQVAKGLTVYNGVMYASQGTGYPIRKTSDGAAWADIGGVSNTEARCFCVHGGMLYKARTNIARYSSDPEAATPSWSSAITVGTTEFKILSMVSTQWGLIVLKADGGWLVPGRPGQEDRAYRIDALNWSTRPLDDAVVMGMGVPAVVWSDGMLYIAERGALLRWDGEVATPVGLDLGTGLPSPYPGEVTGLLRHTNFLFVSVGAGSDADENLSSLWAYNGGWHKLADANAKGENIHCLGYTTEHSPHRILYGHKRGIGHLEMPDVTDNPAQYDSPIYAPSGDIVSSAFSAGLPNADKIFLSLGVHVERATSDQTVRVYYRVDTDEEAGWTWLGEITDNGLSTFDLPTASFTKRQISAGSTKTTIQLASVSGISGGDWVCINGEYRQTEPEGTAASIVLFYPLSAAPSAGDWLYPGVSVGKKIWYQLVLTSADKAKTPVVKGIYVKYRVLLKDKRVWRVVTTLAPGAPLLTGQPSGVTVSDTRAALWRLAKRAHIDCCPPDYRTTGEKISVIISDYSEFMVEDKLVEGGGRPEHTYQATLSLLEV